MYDEIQGFITVFKRPDTGNTAGLHNDDSGVKSHFHKNDVLKTYADGNERVHQLIDLALLQNGMLKGEALTRFVKRSVEMIK